MDFPDGIFAAGFLQMAFLQMEYSDFLWCFITLPLYRTKALTL
jgi:hypothetical protein